MIMINGPQVLFDPTMIGSNEMSAQKHIEVSYNKTNPELKKQIIPGVVVSGGTSTTVNYPERITMIREDVVGPNLRGALQVKAPEDRKYSVFVGAAISAGLSTFAQCWITKEEYEEHGVL